MQRCVRRSRVAPVSRSLPSTSFHSSNGRFDVTTTLVRSYDPEGRVRTSRRQLAATYDAGRAAAALAAGPPATLVPAPRLGQHNGAILAELGLERDEALALLVTGAA